MIDIRKELNKMSKERVVALLDAYDEYIQEANDKDKYKDGWKPVCVMEFNDNEFEELFEEI